MTAARQIVAGRTYLLTRRVTQRQLLLRPDDEMNQIVLYCIAEAAQRFNVGIITFLVMSNHEHLEVRDNEGNIPAFVAHLNKMIAKAGNALRQRCENFWSSEAPNLVYLVNPEDQFEKLIYVLTNPVASNLVENAVDWPGVSSLGMNLSGREITVKRPKIFFGENGKMPDEVKLRLVRPDGFEELSQEQWRTKILTAVREVEDRKRAERRVANLGIVGRKEILAAKPTDTPSSLSPRGGLRPNIACRDRERRKEELAKLIAFRNARLDALARYNAGELDVVFPYGTYRIGGVFWSLDATHAAKPWVVSRTPKPLARSRPPSPEGDRLAS